MSRNELWEHDADDRSLDSFGPPGKSKLALDSRPPSSYGGHEYEPPHFNQALSHAGSYSELRHSSYQIPHLGYEPSLPYSPSRPESLRHGFGLPVAPIDDRRSRSVYSVDVRDPVLQRQSTHDVLGTQSRPQSYHYFEDRRDPRVDTEGAALRQATSFLGSTRGGDTVERNPLVGPESISSASLYSSIIRICAEADLETLTKRSVRQHLEQEYEVDLGSRKDEISRMVEAVIEQDVSPKCTTFVDW
jgi:hypothetical protein